ncbi:MAG: inverse autotransporter beta domain-containing protein, partial [Gammaproteobacteria bacterium]
PASPVGGYGRDDDRNIVFCDATGKKLNGGAGESSSANTSARHILESQNSPPIFGIFNYTAKSARGAIKKQLGGVSFSRLILDSAFRDGGADLDLQWRGAVRQMRADAKSAFWRAAEKSGNGMFARLQERGFIRAGGINFSSGAGRLPDADANILGALGESENGAAAWQFRARKGAAGLDELNIGLLFRRALRGGALGGVNMFLDYEKDGADKFMRAGIGGEARAPWWDAFANIYLPLGGGVKQNGKIKYSASGFNAEARLHSPQSSALAGVLGYARRNGEYGQRDEIDFWTGLHYAPAGPVWAEANYRRNNGAVWQIRLGGDWELGKAAESKPASGRAFRARDYFFAPARREYSQRIRTAAQNGAPSFAEANGSDFAVYPIASGEKVPASFRNGAGGQWENIFQGYLYWQSRLWSKIDELYQPGDNEDGGTGYPRAQAFHSFALAVALLTGAYDADVLGESEDAARLKLAGRLTGLAERHTANGGRDGIVWGGNIDSFRAANFAAHAAAAAWMIWDDIPSEARIKIANMAHYEAARVAAKAPEYANDLANSDTSAENVGWDAWILEVAANMFSQHQDAEAWRTAAAHYRLAAMASPADREEIAAAESCGEPPPYRYEIAGINLNETYALGNHGGFPHPSYTAGAARQPLFGMMYYMLGGNTPPAENIHNTRRVYRMLMRQRWLRTNRGIASPSDNTGDAIYLANGNINWPNTIGRERASNFWVFAGLDAMVGMSGLDEGLIQTAAHWESLHLAELEKLQRPPGGEKLSSGAIVTPQHTRFSQHNQARDLAAVHLAHWLSHNGGFNLPQK